MALLWRIVQVAAKEYGTKMRDHAKPSLSSLQLPGGKLMDEQTLPLDSRVPKMLAYNVSTTDRLAVDLMEGLQKLQKNSTSQFSLKCWD